MSRLRNFTLYTALLENHQQINQHLLNGLNTFMDDESTRKSHHFFGRYENIYISSDNIPALDSVISAVKNLSGEILNCPTEKLKAGLWFNVMNPGDKTTRHQHDDDDELLSAVYYIQVAENSGKLLIGKNAVATEVTPEEGMFVFFSPNMPHEVSENMSDQCRISLGINIGPV